ncbi:unnamed protein product [Medioppia subpectinata]|uniref:Uncharacterized protein n=1 Tax=Medioppia subpectinata TaxID=1979941 RepID=A0A7R9KPF9_9ACAR|nr:unnamed protein product [Medioppia subpectinata]CAG2107361.1 unnamed protein product [Medioppia subpectinata]
MSHHFCQSRWHICRARKADGRGTGPGKGRQSGCPSTPASPPTTPSHPTTRSRRGGQRRQLSLPIVSVPSLHPDVYFFATHMNYKIDYSIHI